MNSSPLFQVLDKIVEKTIKILEKTIKIVEKTIKKTF